MAIIKDDEESKTKQRPVGGGTSYLGGGYAGGGAGASSSPSYSQSGGGAAGSFTNLSSYLYGGEAQGQEVGAGLSRQVDESGDQANRDITTLGTNAAAELKAGTPTANADDVTALANSTLPDKALIGTEWNGVAPQAPAPAAPPAAVAYTGPDEASKFTGYGQAQKSVQATQEMTGNKGIGSFEGIQSMLRGGQGAGYTQGMAMYDTMFAKQGGRGEIEGAQKKWSGIGDTLKAKESDINRGVGFAKATADSTNKAWSDAYKNAQTNQESTNKQYQRLNEARKIASSQPGAGAGNYTTPAQQGPDPQVAERTKWIGPLKVGGIKDGWIWSQEDINNYINTGNKPNRRQEAYGVYSTSTGDY